MKKKMSIITVLSAVIVSFFTAGAMGVTVFLTEDFSNPATLTDGVKWVVEYNWSDWILNNPTTDNVIAGGRLHQYSSGQQTGILTRDTFTGQNIHLSFDIEKPAAETTPNYTAIMYGYDSTSRCAWALYFMETKITIRFMTDNTWAGSYMAGAISYPSDTVIHVDAWIDPNGTETQFTFTTAPDNIIGTITGTHIARPNETFYFWNFESNAGNVCGSYFDNIIIDDAPREAPPSPCGDYAHPYPTGDLTGDCEVNFEDLAMLVANWLEDNRP